MRKNMISRNETVKGNKRFFAITSLGKNRWYWVVWPSLSELQTSTTSISHVAEGVEETKADAIEKALDVAGRFGTWIAAKYAKAHYQNTKAGATPKAYRTLVKGTHPDGGGSHDKFLELQAAYEQALRLCR